MTKIAIPHWQGRVSPVFDVAGHVLLVDVSASGLTVLGDVGLGTEDPQQRAALLAAASIEVLVCGAISRPVEAAVKATGIEVISQVCGGIDQVINAYVSGRLGQRYFVMPGCYGRRCRRGGHRGGRDGV
jgi:predicted Fe-Mo cluster-binding NifX family protein